MLIDVLLKKNCKIYHFLNIFIIKQIKFMFNQHTSFRAYGGAINEV